MARRAQTSTPPKPASDILANATNSAIRPGGVDVADSGISGAGTATGANPGAWSRLRTAAPQGQPVFIVFHPKGGVRGPNGLRGLCFSRLLRPILRVPARRLWK